ncbi:S-layer homology domain-containing protein, partial [Anaerovorax odorimutans]|uniref:S-layer homology domain-containing protein n=1 Tax=Anaerovorax odorimutans TaxID=109327 RepID=UPI0006863CD1
TYVKVKDPSHGSVTVNTDGTFTYTPDTNYVGTDSFTWKVNDGTVYSEEATATITVNEVNDAPTVKNSTKNGTEDTTMSFTAADFNGAEIYADEESDTLSKIQITGLPANGKLKLSETDITLNQEINAADLGSIKFVPTADFNGDTSFTWKASDGNSYSSAATMTLHFAATNDIPGAPLNVTVVAGNAQVTVSFSTPTDNGGTPITKYIVTSDPAGIIAEGTSSPITVTGLTNGTAYTFKVKAVNSVGTGSESAASATVTPHVSSSGGSSGGSSGRSGGGSTSTESGATATVLVNGKSETVAESTTSKEGEKTVTTVVVNEAKLEEKMRGQGDNYVITIPVSKSSDVVVGQLNGQIVKNMEEKEAVLEIKTKNVTYSIPAAQIDISSASEQIGSEIQLKDIVVSLRVAEPAEKTLKVVQSTADKNSYQIVVQPVQFEISCTNEGKTVDVSRFNSYVERMVAIPTEVDPSKITTGIVLNVDGTFSHVPTQIVAVDGKYYAKINSLTNSTYSVIWSPKTFKDVENHWSKEAVNDMGSRLIANGTDSENFSPNRNITRAEFASILVKGLGLMRTGTGKDIFEDVSKNNWYYDAVSIAYENGLVSGVTKKEFNPAEQITREQAMVMVARAMKLTGIKYNLTEEEINKQLSKFMDSDLASSYAESSIAACIETGLVSGKSDTKVAPKDYITRAEVAATIERLLQKSGLI